MRGRLRNWDSKITFFAFADVITSVSGMLIFITLLLATDLDRQEQSNVQDSDRASEQKLQEALRKQAEADSQNQRLQELLALAETSPTVEKLQSDIAELRAQLANEERKRSSLSTQLASNQSEVDARDRRLGLTDLKSSIERAVQESQSLSAAEAKTRAEMGRLETEVLRAQSQLLKVRQTEGQLWLIPDRAATTKEPILVTVAGAGLTIDRFDHPEQHRQLEKSTADSAFKAYLHEAKPLDQYIVFLVRPSGIELFQELLKTAHASSFDVGFDALEEGKQTHFETFKVPSPDEGTALPSSATDATNEPPPTAAPVFAPTNAVPATGGNAKAGTASTNSLPIPPLIPKPKSWWRRFLEWAHLA